MTYTTRTKLVARFGQGEIDDLAGEAPGEGDTDAKIDAAVADAAAEIDGRLAHVYEMPLPAGEYPALTAIASDLARLRLYDEAVPDPVRARAKAAREQLGRIVSGESALVGPSGVVARRTDARAVGRDRSFSRSSSATGELEGLDRF